MIKKGHKGDSLPVHLGLSSEDHVVRWDSLILLFSNDGRHTLNPFTQEGGNGCRGRKKVVVAAPAQQNTT